MLPKDNIRRFRKEKRLSQAELAKKTNKLNQSQIAKIETGRRSISTNDLFDIAQALGIDAEKLLERDGEEDKI